MSERGLARADFAYQGDAGPCVGRAGSRVRAPSGVAPRERGDRPALIGRGCGGGRPSCAEPPGRGDDRRIFRGLWQHLGRGAVDDVMSQSWYGAAEPGAHRLFGQRRLGGRVMGCAGGYVEGGPLGGGPILPPDAFRHRADIEIVGGLHLTAFLFPSFPLRILSGRFLQHHRHGVFFSLRAFLPRSKPRGAIESPGMTSVLCGRASTVPRLSPVRPASIGIRSLRFRLAGS